MAAPMDSPEELAMFESFRPAWQGSVANSEASTQESDGSKKQRTNNDGQWSRQKRQWQPSKPWYGWEGTAGLAPPNEDEVAKLKACIAQLQRLVLRHEDSINLAKIEVSFVAHFRIDSPNSLVKSIFSAADTWKKSREQDPKSVNKPLRATLLRCVFRELRTRLTEMNEEQAKRLQTLGWYDPATKEWAYLRWNASDKALEKDPNRSGVSTDAVLEALASIDTAAPQQHAVARFHPTRPLAAEMKGESLTFLVQFGQQNDHAEKLCTVMPLLCGLAVTQLIAMAIKPERLQRSNLANLVSEAYIGS